MPHFLGLDLGTSAVKALLVDDTQAIRAAAAVTLATSRPHPGWSEQDPDDWWRAAEAAMAALRAEAPAAFAEVAAIGLSGQMHGATLLGADDRPLRPAILWNDGRAVAECADLRARVPDIDALAGAPAVPGLAAPKLLWVARHEPEIWRQVRRILAPKDYLRLVLTGEAATDPCDAAGMLLLDEAARDWSPRLTDAAGLTPGWLPRIAEGPSIAGRLGPAIAARLGLAAGTPVAAGAGDAAAAAIGVGFVTAGETIVSLGTSAQVTVMLDRYRPAPGLVLQSFAHGVPGLWFRSAALLNGASALEWGCGLLGLAVGDGLARAEAAFRGPSPLLFLPYLSGERTPHDDPDARGVIFGLSPATGPADVVQAVAEGVAFALADGRDCLAAAGDAVSAVALVGGGARSVFWTRIIAAVLDLPVTRYVAADGGPAFGAARLARIALTGEAVAAVCVKPPVLDETTPDPALAAAYAARLPRFRALYRALRPEFAAGG